jgi:P63C domain
LIDEATGYQEFRSRTELQALLAAYLAEELLPWSQRFPIAYYQEMFRLWGWQWPPSSGIQGPRYAGKLTKQIIYDRLPGGVLQELESRNPPDENWQRRDRHHQHLTPEIGQPHLEKQVAVATNLMKVCDDKDEFLEKFERAFPGTFTKAKQLNLFRKSKKE